MRDLVRDGVAVMNELGLFGWMFCLGAPVLSVALLRVTKLMILPLVCWVAVVGLCVAGFFFSAGDPSGENQGYVLYTLMLLLMTWCVFGMVLIGAVAGRLIDRRYNRGVAEPECRSALQQSRQSAPDIVASRGG